MKKLFLIYFLIAIYSSISFAQQWEQLPIVGGISIPSHNISYGTPDVGYGGFSTLHEDPNLNKTKVFKTTNKGESWTLNVEFPGSADLLQYNSYRISFINQDTGWIEFKIDFPISARNVRIFRTLNGGLSWNLVNEPGFHYQELLKLQFININVGYRLEKDENGLFYIYKN